MTGAVPHGMSLMFMDWALAHEVGDETKLAYLRSDAFN
jgi:hypothetical protein